MKINIRNKIKEILFFICYVIVESASGQSPTYQALVKLNYNIDNNEYNLKSQSGIDSNFYWANIFFNYYKNPNTRGLMKADEDMIFSVGYEYLICENSPSDVGAEYVLVKKSKTDKIQILKIYQINSQNSKEVSLKRKDFKKTEKGDTVFISINKGVLQEDSRIKVYCKLESFSFKELNLHLKPLTEGEKYISFNVPDIFKYSNSTLYEKPKETLYSPMVLKHFTYSSPPIVDYQVKSSSLKWEVFDLDQSFVLEAINFPVFFGTSVERIMSRSE